MELEKIINNNIISQIKPLAFTKWQEVFNVMAVHTNGAVPNKIFKDRRPIESENIDAYNFRVNNYRNITTNEFEKAISDYITTGLAIDVNVDYGSNDDLEDYVNSLKIRTGLSKYTIKEWVIKRIGAIKQTDPNALVVIIPKHISKEFIPHYAFEVPTFNDILNMKIDIDIRLVKYNEIVYLDSEQVVFYGGKYFVNDKNETKPYYISITKESTKLIVPKQEDNKLSYYVIDYYNNNLSEVPYVHIGSKYVIDGDIEYFISDYYGAAGWGDLAIGQGSDLRISEIRFVYPRHWKIKIPCDNTLDEGCHYDNGTYVTNNGSTCKRCNGTGYIMDTTPTGTLLVQKGGDFLDDNGKFTQPEGFITPDTTILQHSANREAYYFDMMLNALGVSKQNMTNQSGESKKYDSAFRVAMVSGIITNLFNVYENILNLIAEYRGGENTVTVTMPEDLDVRNSADYIEEINNAKLSSAPYIVIVELTKRYILKNFGDTPTNQFLLNELSKIDKIFGYGSTELMNAKASLGSDLTLSDIILHNQGFQIIKDLYDSEVINMQMTTSEINQILMKYISENYILKQTEYAE